LWVYDHPNYRQHYQLFNERTRRHTTVPYHNRIFHAERLRRSFGKPG